MANTSFFAMALLASFATTASAQPPAHQTKFALSNSLRLGNMGLPPLHDSLRMRIGRDQDFLTGQNFGAAPNTALDFELLGTNISPRIEGLAAPSAMGHRSDVAMAAARVRTGSATRHLPAYDEEDTPFAMQVHVPIAHLLRGRLRFAAFYREILLENMIRGTIQSNNSWLPVPSDRTLPPPGATESSLRSHASAVKDTRKPASADRPAFAYKQLTVYSTVSRTDLLDHFWMEPRKPQAGPSVASEERTGISAIS